MKARIADLSPATYQQSRLHASDRDWPETNCYTDMWIEILHATGAVPEAGLSFTLTQDFEGDHFTFFKFPQDDLEALYGAGVTELAIYDTVEAHVLEQTGRGRMTLVEADSFYLPDTAGTAYRHEHTKSTIAINAIDPAAKRLQYFHNAGFYALDGEDYDGALGRLQSQIDGHMLYPYVEFIKFGPGLAAADLANKAVGLLRRHLARRAPANPIALFQQALPGHAELVASRPPEFFHKYAFNTFRQIGANFELLASHLAWLAGQGQAGLEPAIAAARRISSEAKIMQFQLARAVARKKTDALAAKLEPMKQAYDEVIGTLLHQYPDAT